jgi:hypothetical protein
VVAVKLSRRLKNSWDAITVHGVKNGSQRISGMMSSIEAIEKYLKKEKDSLPLSEVKRRCEEFVKKRDANEPRNTYHRRQGGSFTMYAFRDGKKIEREKV